ncbi:MAG: hypothetical protein II623_04925, partial [Paludibacteraceae bacterium]|nr:hypothetical protein [Paludibacteraceae bacterium]
MFYTIDHYQQKDLFPNIQNIYKKQEVFCITEIIIHVKPPTGLLYAGDDLKITTTWGKSHKHNRNSFHKLHLENNINSFERSLTKQGKKIYDMKSHTLLTKIRPTALFLLVTMWQWAQN